MSVPVFIGDRLTAAGFRLAGVRPLVTSPAEALDAFRTALARGSAVIITASLAAQLPGTLLEQAVLAASPPVAVIPDMTGERTAPDIARRVRRALGVET